VNICNKLSFFVQSDFFGNWGQPRSGSPRTIDISPNMQNASLCFLLLIFMVRFLEQEFTN